MAWDQETFRVTWTHQPFLTMPLFRSSNSIILVDTMWHTVNGIYSFLDAKLVILKQINSFAYETKYVKDSLITRILRQVRGNRSQTTFERCHCVLSESG